MYLIYISGIDGCGKTTQAKRLAAWLEERGLSAEYQWLRWEPSVLPLIRQVRRIFTRSSSEPSMDKPAAPPDFASDENKRYDRWISLKEKFLHTPMFRKIWLSYATRDYYRTYCRASSRWSGDYIVLDRYLYDFAVDQSLNLGMSVGDFQQYADNSVLRQVRQPDLCIFIHIPADAAWLRKQDGTPLNYLRRREEPYRAKPASATVLHLDGMQDIDSIQREISAWVGERVTERRP